MKLKPYPKYKFSDEQWLGSVPTHWSIAPLKTKFSIFGGSTPKSEQEEFWDGEIVWVTPADLNNSPSLAIHGSSRKITSAGLASCATTLVPAGSIVLSTRAPIGSLGIAAVELCTNQGCKSLVPMPGVHSSFYALLLTTVTADLNVRGKGTTFLELSTSELGAFKVAVPPSDEQSKIAFFLECEIAKIDTLIAKQEKLIEILNEKRQAMIFHAVTKGVNSNALMKSSGVEWLGEVPEQWCVRPLKSVMTLVGRIGYRGYTTDDLVSEGEGAITLSPSNLLKGRLSLTKCTYISWDKYKESPEIMLEKEDVVLVKTGSTLGKVAFVDSLSTSITINPQLAICKKIKCNKKFLFYLLAGRYIQSLIDVSNTGGTIPTMTQETINNFKAGWPPIAEQTAIVTYLDEVTRKLDKLTEKAQEAIALQKEHRASLISSVVTGKIDVRNTMLDFQAAA